jgi:hypothetical protein
MTTAKIKIPGGGWEYISVGAPGPEGPAGPPGPEGPPGSGDVSTLVPKDTTITAEQPDPGWLMHLYINYAAPTGDPESIFVESSASGTRHRVFWLNENGVPRCASSRTSEVPLKVHGFSGGQAASANIFEVWDKWTTGRRVLWSINRDGRPVIGSNPGGSEILGSNVITLGPSDPVPTGTPTGTVIVRTTT